MRKKPGGLNSPKDLSEFTEMKPIYLFLFFLIQGKGWAQPFSPDNIRPIVIGDRQINSGLFQEARQTGWQALQQARRSPADVADIYMLIGRSYAREENWDSALIFYTQALQLRRNVLKDPIATAKTLTSMATAIENQNELHLAQQVALEADSILRTQRGVAIPVQAMLFNNIANIYEGLDSLDRAIEYNKKSLALFPFTKDTLTKVKGEYGLAQRLLSKEDFIGVRLHLDTALMFVRAMAQPDSLLMGQSYEMLAAIDIHKDPPNPTKAIEYLEMAKEIYLHFPQAETYLTNIFYKLGAAYESANMVDSAIVSYNRALKHYNEQSAEPNYLELMETRVESSYNQKGREAADYKLRLALYCLILALLALLAITLRKNRNERAAAAEKSAAQELSRIQEVQLIKITLIEEIHQTRLDFAKKYLLNVDQLLADCTSETALNTIKKIKVLTNRILAEIGYVHLIEKPTITLRLLASKMHLEAEVAAMMPVINDTYMDGLPDITISEDLEKNLAIIVQESFVNIQKYAFNHNTAQNICSIRFEYAYDLGLILTISDQGKGFDPRVTKRSGLRTIENVANQIDAQFQLESIPGKGTTLRLTISNFSPVFITS